MSYLHTQSPGGEMSIYPRDLRIAEHEIILRSYFNKALLSVCCPHIFAVCCHLCVGVSHLIHTFMYHGQVGFSKVFQ